MNQCYTSCGAPVAVAFGSGQPRSNGHEEKGRETGTVLEEDGEPVHGPGWVR